MFSSCSAVSAPVCWVLASALLEYLESNLLALISHSQNWAVFLGAGCEHAQSPTVPLTSLQIRNCSR